MGIRHEARSHGRRVDALRGFLSSGHTASSSRSPKPSATCSARADRYAPCDDPARQAAPWWLPLIGNFFAIIVVKQLYGGIGKNFLNPALAGRAFLIASYAVIMTQWTIPSAMAGMNIETVDGITMATPMTYLYAGKPMPEYYSYLNMFLGIMPGCFGEVEQGRCCLVGGIYLLICRKIISWRIPVSFIGTVALLTLIFGHAAATATSSGCMYNLLSGGLFLGAFFMATDYATSPVTLPRPAPLRRRLRRADRAHPLFRQLPRRRVLRHPHHEPAAHGPIDNGVPPSSVRRRPRKTSPKKGGAEA